MTKEAVESYWTRELGENVEIREWNDWDELDIYVDGQFCVTVGRLEHAAMWLERYSHVQKFTGEVAV